MQVETKESELLTLISEKKKKKKLDLKLKTVTRNKDHYVKIKGTNSRRYKMFKYMHPTSEYLNILSKYKQI